MASTITDECIGCGNCEPECPSQAVVKVAEELYAIDAERCDDCAPRGGRCLGLDTCPTGAIVAAEAPLLAPA